MAEHPAVAFHMGALAHDLAMLEAESESPAHGVGMPQLGIHVCPAPADGGMCGCDDAEDGPPKVCLSRECDC